MDEHDSDVSRLLLEDADDQAVGYGRPPVKTRFKPGQSGNLAGRPRGSRNKPPTIGDQRLQRILLDAFNRKIPVMDGGRKRMVTMLEATVHTLTMKAVKGDFRSQQAVISEQKQIEARQEADWSTALETVLWYQKYAHAELKKCEAEDREPAGLFLHPDDIHVDFKNRKIVVFGPVSPDHCEDWKKIDNVLMLEEDLRIEIDEMKARFAKAEPTAEESVKFRSTLALRRALRVALAPIPTDVRTRRRRSFEAKVRAEIRAAGADR